MSGYGPATSADFYVIRGPLPPNEVLVCHLRRMKNVRVGPSVCPGEPAYTALRRHNGDVMALFAHTWNPFIRMQIAEAVVRARANHPVPFASMTGGEGVGGSSRFATSGRGGEFGAVGHGRPEGYGGGRGGKEEERTDLRADNIPFVIVPRGPKAHYCGNPASRTFAYPRDRMHDGQQGFIRGFQYATTGDEQPQRSNLPSAASGRRDNEGSVQPADSSPYVDIPRGPKAHYCRNPAGRTFRWPRDRMHNGREGFARRRPLGSPHPSIECTGSGNAG